MSSSLCPGYKQVESFGPDEDYESDEEEVCYVTLDLGSIEPTLVPSSSTYRLIGLDTPTPFLQLSGTVLKGHHDSLLGTELLFTEDKDETDRTKRTITHLSTTEQRILFKEVRLQPKAKSRPDGLTGLDPDLAPSSSSAPPPPPASAPTQTSEEAAEKIDRLTGKSAPPTRAGRGRGAKGKSKGKAKEGEEEPDSEMHDLGPGAGQEGEEAPRRSTRSSTRAKPGSKLKPKPRAKGKGKEKAVEYEDDEPPSSPPPDGDGDAMDVAAD